MENEYYAQLENLLLSGEKENIKLAFVLEQSLNLDLTPILRKMQKAIMIAGYGYEEMPLEDIPEQLPFIENINIGTNVDFRDIMKYLSFARSLQLYDNTNGIFFSFYTELKNLEELSIESAFLKELPDWVYQLKNLQSLSLNCKNLTNFSDNFGNLCVLETLSLDCSPNLQIPLSANKVKNIKSFHLYNTIPLGLSNFKRLGLCNWYDITTIPESLENLEMEELFISGQLTLPENAHYLGTINHLNLYIYNSTKEKLGPKYAALKKVKRLTLSFSTVGLAEEIFSIQGIEHLVFMYARFYEIPSAMANFKENLKTLELVYCDIPDEGIEALEKILPHTKIVEQYNNYGWTKRKYQQEQIRSFLNDLKRWFFVLFFLLFFGLLIINILYWIWSFL